MKLLKDILYKVSVNAVYGDTNVKVAQVDFDSRKVIKDSLFVAQKGTSVDGHLYIDKAISLGATTIICEELPIRLEANITFIQVEDSSKTLAIIASNFYDNPSSKLKLIGVTGTNGKTTVASLLYQLLKKSGYKTGLLSTVQILVDTTVFNATHTTPDSVTINYYLHKMVLLGVDYCFMEVSSHGIHQKRTEGLEFAGGIFTNLSHDHLDYHVSFASYRDVKKSFFDSLPKKAFAENLKKIITISDRRQAIKTACKFSETGDILLIAGKGHENYQEISGERFHFDDLVEVKKYFNLLKK